MSNIIHPVY